MHRFRFLCAHARRVWLGALLWVAAITAAQAAPVKFDLPAGNAATSLAAFAQQAGVEVLFSYTDLKSVPTPALAGAFEPQEAIDRLLRGTGFAATRNAAGKFIVTRERAPRPTGEIRGTIVGDGDGAPVAGAFVRLAESSLAVRANAAGQFVLRDVPGEPQVLVVSAEGFVTLRVPGVAQTPGRRTDLGRVRLRPAGEGAEQLAEMVVNASDLGAAFGAASLFALQAMIVTPSRFGVETERAPVAATLTQSDLLALPQLGDDLYRAISHLPGLAADDLTARFWVRGAPHEQVRARLDGVDLIEPFHLKDTDGSLSILDLETIGRLDLYTGGFTAEYGDRLAGVLTMETDRYMRAGSRTTLGLSFTGGRAASRGQTADGRHRWLASVRSGFPDAALKQANGNPDEVMRPRYYDAMVKWETDLTRSQTLSLHALHAGDRMYFRDDKGSTLTSSYGSDYLWARWRGDFGRVQGEGVLSFTDVTWHRDGNGLLDRVLGLSVHERRELREFALRQDWTASISERALVRGGFEFARGSANYVYRNFRDRYVFRNGGFAINRSSLDERVSPDGERGGAYFSTRWQPVPAVTFEPGLRYDANNHAHDSDLSPRFNAAWRVGRTTARAAWGVYTQAQGLHELAVPDGDTLFRRAERAEHRVLSLEQQLAGGVNVRLEGYERRVTHSQPHWENAVDNSDALPEVTNDRVRIAPLHELSRGLELIVEQRAGAKFAWSASYALARAEDTLGGGVIVQRARDQRHTLYLDATYSPDPRWQFSVAWQYHSGWPTTAYVFSTIPLAGGGTAVVSNLGPLNALSLPDYMRLDLRVQRRLALSRGSLRLYLDVFNALGRRNVINYAYSINLDSANRLSVTRHNGSSLLPLLPSVGATWDF